MDGVVPVSVALLGERGTAYVATVRFLPCMSSYVGDQRAARGERLIAGVTSVWLLPGVYESMLIHAYFLRKLRVTHVTFVRLFSSMYSHMFG